MEGRPFAKRGKMSGGKQVVRCDACGRGARRIVPEGRAASARCACGAPMEPLLVPALEGGKIVSTPRPPRELRRKVLDQVARFRSRKEGP